MKQVINRCDKCRTKTDELIDLMLVNQHCETEDENKDGNEEESGWFSFFGKKKQHPTLQLELCETCTKTLLHWLGHPENTLREIAVKKEKR